MNIDTRRLRLSRHQPALPALALALLLSLAGCAGEPVTRIGDKKSDFMLALPRVEVVIDREGNPSIAGFGPALLEKASGGRLNMDDYRLPRDWVAYFVSTNTQHVELLQKDDGLYIWVNSRRMPNISYDGAQLRNLGALAGQTEVLKSAGASPTVNSVVLRMLPLLQKVGLNLIVRFPRADGSAEISARDAKESVAPLLRAAAAPAHTPVAAVRVVINYNEAGDPSIAGLTPQDVQDIFGINLEQAALTPAVIARMMKQNITRLTLRTDGEGLAMAVNEQPLPTLQCDKACLTNLGETFAQLNTYPELAYLNDPVRAFAPYLRSVDAEFALRFPQAQSAPSGTQPDASPTALPAQTPAVAATRTPAQ